MNGSPTDVSADDASLLASSQAGDVAAFGHLIERYHNLVCAIAYSRTGDRVASEDIAQETFLAAWNGIAGLREPEKLRAWLCGIARNLGGKTLRSRRREAVTDIDDLEGQILGDPGPLSAMLSKELEATVWEALQKLPATYREPLVLFYREEQSIKQVAQGLGLTEEAAKQRLSRGRLSLKENIGDLVEQTLQAGRPRKAAIAAAVAIVVAAQGTKTALAAPVATTGRASRWIAAGLGAAMCAAMGVAIFSSPSPPFQVARSSPSGDPREALAQLRRAHDAWQANTGGAHACELHGRVSRGDGTALSGALVAVVEHSWQATALEPIIVKTDDRGRWKTLLPAGTYTVSVSAPGGRAQVRDATCAPSRVEDLAFALQTGGSLLRGSITDAGGGPIAGVTVWLLDPQRPSEIFVTRSGADGRYELLVERGLYMALATHPEYTLDVRPITLGNAGTREDVTLLPGASIEGTVVDITSGARVPGAKVNTLAPSLQNPDDAPMRWRMASFYGALLPEITDADGRFRIRGLTPGNVRLTARSSAYATSNPTSIDLTLAETKTGATIAVAAARTISGFVVPRGDERRGLQTVQLVAVREDAPLAMPIVTTTDGAGFFALSGLTPGQYRITAVASGYAPYVAEQPISIAAHDVTDTVVVLDRGVTLRGRVETADRTSIKLQPATAATSPVSYIKAAMTRAEVDERGNFMFAAVAPGDYVIVATTFNRRAEIPVHVANSDQIDLRMKLEPRPSITGQVIDDAGAKLPGLLVAAVPSRMQDPFAMMHTTVRTDENGAFEIVGVAAGRYDLRVFDAKGQRSWAGGPKRHFKARRVDVPATGTVTETLQVNSGGGRVTGIVVGADHRPVADSWVEVRARDAHRMPELFPPPPILTDAAGRFAIDGLFGSELIIEASGPDGSQRAVASAAPGAKVELQLGPIATLIGKVTLDGQPVAALDVRLRDALTELSRRTHGLAGQFSMPASAGEHELVVTSSPGYARQPFTIGHEATATVEIALVPWGSVRGRIVGSDGKPWAGATLLLRESVEPSLARTDAAGNFSIDRVIAGHNELSIMNVTERDQFTTVEIEITPGQHLDLDVIEARSWRAATTTADMIKALSQRSQTTASSSSDLGVQLFVSIDPPTPAQLAAVASDPLIASRAGKDPNAVLWIAAVDPKGSAARAGLRKGDRIVGVGMSKVDGGQSAVDMMMSLSRSWRSKGRAVPWAVVRGSRELHIDVLVPN